MPHIATIQFYRGAEAGLPALADGEPGWTTDTHKLFIGQAGVNFEITGSSGGTGTGTADCCYSDEMAQDAIGGILVNSSSIGFTYTDGTPSITASVINGSITYAKLSASGATAGQMLIYNGSGLDWSTPATSYTNEEAQDAVGNILTDSSTIDFTYDDTTPSITAIIKDNSVTLAKISTSGATTGYVIGYDGANIVWMSNGDTGTGSSPTGYTDEEAQDAVGGILVDSPTIDFTYNDGVPSITASIVADSIQGSHIMDGTIDNSDLANNCIASNNLQTGCVTLPKISTTGATTGYVIGFDGVDVVWMSNGDTGTGTSGGSSYTDEQAQDAVGTIVDSGSNGQVGLSYDDSTPAITANLSARGFAAIMARISMRG